MDLLKSVRSHQDIHNLREPPVAVKEKRHAARNRVWNPKLVQSPRDGFERLVDRALLLEVHTSFFQRPPRVAIQKLLIDRHGLPPAQRWSLPFRGVQNDRRGVQFAARW